MTSWENFIARRDINFEKFKIKNKINTKEDLQNYCLSQNIIPPSDSHLASLFPVKETPVQGVPVDVIVVEQEQQPSKEKKSSQKSKSKEKVNDVE